MSTNRKGLGRGLSALMADVRADDPRPETNSAPAARAAERVVPVEKVRPNPNQPRRSFDQDKLEELAASIKEYGIIQPLVVRPSGEYYEIVAGERRWRASQLAQLHEVPVLVREYNETEMFQIAVVENVQRADLNPMDEANAYWSLIERFGHSQNEVADAVGKSRSHVSNMVRLRELPVRAQAYLEAGELTIGHVRPLIGMPNADELADRIFAKRLSVREVERLVATAKPESVKRPRASKSAGKDADTVELEGDLSATLKMKVEIEHLPGSESGKLVIRYGTLEELDRLCNLLTGMVSED